MSKTILFISLLSVNLDVQKGAPTQKRTVEGYLENNWNVVYINGSGQNDRINSHKSLDVISFNSLIFRRLMKIPKVGFFARMIWWLYFQLASIYYAITYHSEFDVIYAYEVPGVPAAKILSIYYNTPLVSRFQGSKLLPRMERDFWWLRFWDTVLAYKISTDLTIMTNDGTKGDVVLDRMNHKSSKIMFLMNGVDWELFGNNPASNIKSNKKGATLVTISRLVEWKHIDRTIKALPQVVDKHPKTTLIIVGDGPERSNLEKLSQRLGVRENVQFAGRVSHEDVPNYLKKSDIFISMFDYSNIGNPLLEAMTIGCCVVALDTGATGTVIRDEDNGILIPNQNLSHLPERINELIENDTYRQQLALSAKGYAKANFRSWDERIEREVDAVDDLLS